KTERRTWLDRSISEAPAIATECPSWQTLHELRVQALGTRARACQAPGNGCAAFKCYKISGSSCCHGANLVLCPECLLLSAQAHPSNVSYGKIAHHGPGGRHLCGGHDPSGLGFEIA